MNEHMQVKRSLFCSIIQVKVKFTVEQATTALRGEEV
jgi:hypothetical protein